MGFIPTGQRVVMQTAMDKLWEDMQKPVTIVKKALLVATNEGTTFVPGYGEASNETNYVSTPQSGVFMCLRVAMRPDGMVLPAMDKTQSTEELLIKVKQDARDYIMDGREIEHAIYAGKIYNINSEDQSNFFLDNQYYYFRLALTN
jgi:hypothetical protein